MKKIINGHFSLSKIMIRSFRLFKWCSFIMRLNMFCGLRQISTARKGGQIVLLIVKVAEPCLN